MEDEILTDEEVYQVTEALNSRRVDDLVSGVMSIEKVLVAIKGVIAKVDTSALRCPYHSGVL